MSDCSLMNAEMWDWPADGGDAVRVPTIALRDAIGTAIVVLTGHDATPAIEAALADAPPGALANVAEFVGGTIASRAHERECELWDCVDRVLARFEGACLTPATAVLAVHELADVVHATVDVDAVLARLRADALALAATP